MKVCSLVARVICWRIFHFRAYFSGHRTLFNSIYLLNLLASSFFSEASRSFFMFIWKMSSAISNENSTSSIGEEKKMEETKKNLIELCKVCRLKFETHARFSLESFKWKCDWRMQCCFVSWCKRFVASSNARRACINMVTQRNEKRKKRHEHNLCSHTSRTGRRMRIPCWAPKKRAPRHT